MSWLLVLAHGNLYQEPAALHSHEDEHSWAPQHIVHLNTKIEAERDRLDEKAGEGRQLCQQRA